MNRITIVALILPLWITVAHAQVPWSAAPSSPQGGAAAMPWFPFAPQAQRAPASAPATQLPFPWMAQGSQQQSAQPWGAPAPGYAPGMPAMGMFPFGPQAGAGSGAMGMMMAPMMGFMAPMMTNYAIASMNPTTMGNFFGMMANPGGGIMPFGGFGFPGAAAGQGFGFGSPGGYSAGTPSPPFWMQPWPMPAQPAGAGAGAAPAWPPFFPFFNAGGLR